MRREHTQSYTVYMYQSSVKWLEGKSKPFEHRWCPARHFSPCHSRHRRALEKSRNKTIEPNSHRQQAGSEWKRERKKHCIPSFRTWDVGQPRKRGGDNNRMRWTGKAHSITTTTTKKHSHTLAHSFSSTHINTLDANNKTGERNDKQTWIKRRANGKEHSTSASGLHRTQQQQTTKYWRQIYLFRARRVFIHFECLYRNYIVLVNISLIVWLTFPFRKMCSSFVLFFLCCSLWPLFISSSHVRSADWRATLKWFCSIFYYVLMEILMAMISLLSLLTLISRRPSIWFDLTLCMLCTMWIYGSSCVQLFAVDLSIVAEIIHCCMFVFVVCRFFVRCHSDDVVFSVGAFYFLFYFVSFLLSFLFCFILFVLFLSLQKCSTFMVRDIRQCYMCDDCSLVDGCFLLYIVKSEAVFQSLSPDTMHRIHIYVYYLMYSVDFAVTHHPSTHIDCMYRASFAEQYKFTIKPSSHSKNEARQYYNMKQRAR